MDTATRNINFTKDETLSIIAPLSEETERLWGIMTAQHMIEHLVGSWRISNGKAQVASVYEGEKLERNRKFLFSDSPYPRNLKNPVLKDQELPHLRKKDLNEAKDINNGN